MDVGTWKDIGITGVSSSASKPYNAIDPNLNEHGSNYYLTFGSYWQVIYQVQMASNPKAISGSAKQLVSSSDGEVVEGAYIFKYGSYYYLFYSKGSSKGSPARRQARSTASSCVGRRTRRADSKTRMASRVRTEAVLWC